MLFRSADGSTLFLDEIGELPLEAQSRLLRVLQEGEIRRVGSTDRTYVNVRLVAATHRNLLEMVARGQFREDLYYRLNVIELRCPPLRERDGDILLLAESFLERVKHQMNRSELKFSGDARSAIECHAWPGNVRELENCIERAVVLCNSDTIQASHLPPTMQQMNSKKMGSVDQQGLSLQQMVDNLEREVITDVLRETKGNQARAARMLGTTQRVMGYKINKLSINPHLEKHRG